MYKTRNWKIIKENTKKWHVCYVTDAPVDTQAGWYNKGVVLMDFTEKGERIATSRLWWIIANTRDLKTIDEVINWFENE